MADNVTPEFQYDFLEEHAKVIGMVLSSPCTTKYYIFNNETFKVVILNDKVKYVSRVSEDEVGRILSCNKLDFGEW